MDEEGASDQEMALEEAEEEVEYMENEPDQ